MARIALVVGVLLVLTLVTLSFNRDSEEPIDTSAWGRDVSTLLAQIRLDYTKPMNAAATAMDIECWALDPRTSDPECESFVQAIERHDPALIRAIGELELILANPHPRATEDLLGQLQRNLDLMKTAHESNVLLTAGWINGDGRSWREGWSLRRSIGADFSAASPGP